MNSAGFDKGVRAHFTVAEERSVSREFPRADVGYWPILLKKAAVATQRYQ
jgi:hypothetical protein